MGVTATPIDNKADQLVEEASTAPAPPASTPVKAEAAKFHDFHCDDAPDQGWAIFFQVVLGRIGVGYGFIGQWGLFPLAISAIVPLGILQIIYTACFALFAVVLWIFGIVAIS